MTTPKIPKINRNGWTVARRKRQSQAIHRWKPWQQSTGAKTEEGKATVSRNAYKGGVWIKLKALRRETRALLREQRDMLDKLKQ
ncbi:hypothetical protein GCM10009007_09410 [Formosimonas limnophila]|uniref:Uncharacterized protein n=1 Tax=Formosimonas limnophila TaxID=1384487 RepID=A0A8J3CMU8_9BURK|nr:hypothetical protein GCM10009007_09410 [Formosimonas limnophila]